MYSDYYFLHDNLKPLRPGMAHNKSAEEFHYRVTRQIDEFDACVSSYILDIESRFPNVAVRKHKGSGNKSAGHHTSYLFFEGNGPTLHLSDPVTHRNNARFPLWFRSAQM